MKTEKLDNGLVRLTNHPDRIRDRRNGRLYSEVVCEEREVINFEDE